jgi:Carboxypeptidase regulatory-like domain
MPARLTDCGAPTSIDTRHSVSRRCWHARCPSDPIGGLDGDPGERLDPGLTTTALARLAVAQSQASVQSSAITGSVIDAGTGVPLARSTVSLSSSTGFGVLSSARTGASSFALARTTTTTDSGSYRFADLPVGAYRIRVQRVGYEPATITVELGETGTSPISIGLVVLPVRLHAIEVRATGAGASGADRRSMTSDDRVRAARARQGEFLSTDVRVLTIDDVAESATLGGGDVLRALQRLPGVTQLDDWSAKLWVRGNRWDHNRMYYDGLPLFESPRISRRLS